jgi:hypothetical protein
MKKVYVVSFNHMLYAFDSLEQAKILGNRFDSKKSAVIIYHLNINSKANEIIKLDEEFFNEES